MSSVWASLKTAVKDSPASVRDSDSIPEVGRSPGGGNGHPLQYILVWNIPWTEEPGGLQSSGPQRMRPDWATEQQPSPQHCLRPSCRLSSAALLLSLPRPRTVPPRVPKRACTRNMNSFTEPPWTEASLVNRSPSELCKELLSVCVLSQPFQQFPPKGSCAPGSEL